MGIYYLKLPKMGESIAEATLTNWLKKVGDKVGIDEPVVEIATDKVDSDVPSEYKGVLVKQNFDVDQRMSYVSMDRTQTIMYTSGSTANPKGITFNQNNIISKRFARALALPDFGSEDIFLCYLPLFHTFGRYFELMGSIFWGATYSFAESPAFNSLLKDFPIVNPSIFISIPKRWVQLYEMLEKQLDMDSEDNETIETKLKSITGGKLKWGLSAAGYLDPDIFKFYQSHGVNVLSGYGMTEATGGITMTPPTEYIIDSVGIALPGITLKIAYDGELCLKGSYVTDGYYKEDDSDVIMDGWFHTGDIFEEKDGHYFIIDRKKDIYKKCFMTIEMVKYKLIMI